MSAESSAIQCSRLGSSRCLRKVVDSFGSIPFYISVLGAIFGNLRREISNMTKRRRERDRPKAGPESLYNPNKRVHLSYADSDEEEDLSDITTVEEPKTKLDSRNGAAGSPVGSPNDSAQREEQVKSLEGVDDDEYEPGRAEEEESTEAARVTEKPRKSPEYRAWEPSKARQQTKRNTETIGCLQFPDDDDGGDDEDLEVAKYMRAVQSQRKEIPQILYAAAGTAQEDDVERQNGHNSHGDDGGQEAAGYEDGAFFARSSRPPPPTNEEVSLDPKTVFTARLISRFHAQRTTLHIPATIDELTSLSDATLITFPPHAQAARSHWLQTLHTQPPLPAQIRSIDQSTALNLLELIADSVLLKATDVAPITSAWIWSLLARIDDVGNLYNDEIFPLRQLGKKALFVLLSFKDPEAARGIEELDDDDDDYDDRGSPTLDAEVADGGDVEKAPGPTSNTLATLDMILTIVGQVFGQKDLLQFRQAWDAAATAAE